MTRNKKNRSSRSLSTPSQSPPSQSVPTLSVPVPPEAGSTLPAAGVPLEATVSLAPAAAARLGTEASEKTAAAAAAESALPGWQSLGKDHKPTHANGKQGRRERKVRW